MRLPAISKEAARYTNAGGREHCSLCRHFSPRRGGRCARVLGDISPMGWCRLFSREMRGLVADASSFNGGGGGPSLGLDFMQPGVLDPRITFTRASTGTYFNSAGVMQTAATNAPRWDYDPATLQLRGLLIEEARTNVCLQSTTSSAPWATFGSGATAPTATPNNTIAPDGTMTACRIVMPVVSTGGSLSIYYQSNPLAAQAHTISLYMKGAIGGEQVYVCISNQAGNIFYRLPRATLTTSWQRFSFVSPVLTAENWSFEIGTDLRDAGQAATSAQTIYAWGAQLEAGAFATSHIPTTSAAVTRAVDVATMPTAAWYVAATSTLAIEAMWQTPLTVSPGTFQTGVTIDNGTNTVNLVRIYRSTLDNTVAPQIVAISAGIYNVTIGSLVPGAVTKVAVAYRSGLQASALNGTLGTGTAAAAVPSGMTTLRFGVIAGNLQMLNGHIRAVRYW